MCVLWRNFQRERKSLRNFSLRNDFLTYNNYLLELRDSNFNEVVNKRCFIHPPFSTPSAEAVSAANERSHRQRIGSRKSNGGCISIGYEIWIISEGSRRSRRRCRRCWALLSFEKRVEFWRNILPSINDYRRYAKQVFFFEIYVRELLISMIFLRILRPNIKKYSDIHLLKRAFSC